MTFLRFAKRIISFLWKNIFSYIAQNYDSESIYCITLRQWKFLVFIPVFTTLEKPYFLKTKICIYLSVQYSMTPFFFLQQSIGGKRLSYNSKYPGMYFKIVWYVRKWLDISETSFVKLGIILCGSNSNRIIPSFKGRDKNIRSSKKVRVSTTYFETCLCYVTSC